MNAASRPEPCICCALKEVACGDAVDEGVAIVADGHGELHPLALDLPTVEARLRRYDVVERCHAEAAAGLEEDAEVLAVSVGCREQPEDDDGAEEDGAVGLRLVTAGEQPQDLPHAGATVAFVFGGPWDRKRLTHVLLAERATGVCRR